MIPVQHRHIAHRSSAIVGSMVLTLLLVLASTYAIAMHRHLSTLLEDAAPPTPLPTAPAIRSGAVVVSETWTAAQPDIYVQWVEVERDQRVTGW